MDHQPRLNQQQPIDLNILDDLQMDHQLRLNQRQPVDLHILDDLNNGLIELLNENPDDEGYESN
jgi:hypothetical protein